jgi:Rap1a immunity proteins
MTSFRLSAAALFAIFGTAAQADPPASPRPFSATSYLRGCKDFVAGRSNFFSGRCVGVIEVLDAANADNKTFCAPPKTNNLERVRAVVAYIEANPDRGNEDLRLLANEAMAKVWPCKT